MGGAHRNRGATAPSYVSPAHKGGRIAQYKNDVVGAHTPAYTANSLNQYTQVSGFGSQPCYDVDGNQLTTGLGQAFVWDAENRLVAVEPVILASGDKKVLNTYDSQSRRVRRQVFTYTSGAWGLMADHSVDIDRGRCDRRSGVGGHTACEGSCVCLENNGPILVNANMSFIRVGSRLILGVLCFCLVARISFGETAFIVPDHVAEPVRVTVYMPRSVTWSVDIDGKGGGSIQFGASPTDRFPFPAGTFHLDELLAEIAKDQEPESGEVRRRSLYIRPATGDDYLKASDRLALRMFKKATDAVPAELWNAERLADLLKSTPPKFSPGSELEPALDEPPEAHGQELAPSKTAVSSADRK